MNKLDEIQQQTRHQLYKDIAMLRDQWKTLYADSSWWKSLDELLLQLKALNNDE